MPNGKLCGCAGVVDCEPAILCYSHAVLTLSVSDWNGDAEMPDADAVEADRAVAEVLYGRT